MATLTIEHPHGDVARAFVDQYYLILHQQLDQTHRFYKESSMLSWPQANGKIKSVTTTAGINEFIKSSHFKDTKVEVTTTDSQKSAAGGVLVVVTAWLIGQDNLRNSFSQTFYLAPQENGYYVLNDIFRFVGIEESGTVVTDQDVENASVASVEPTQTTADNSDKEVSDKPETKVTTDNQVHKEVSDKPETKVTNDDQVGDRSSITLKEKEPPVAETASAVENAAPKLSYASMMMQGRSAPPSNVPHRVVRVAANDISSAPKKPQANGLVKAQDSNSNSVSKAATPTNVVQQNNNNSDEEFQCKSIYIGGLPTKITPSELHSVVKLFGPVHSRDVQIKTYEDGYSCGFVHFQDVVSAQNAVQTRHIIVNGQEAYIRLKRINRGRGDRAKSPSNNRGGYHNDDLNGESRGRSQSSDGHKQEGFQQNYKRKDQKGPKS